MLGVGTHERAPAALEHGPVRRDADHRQTIGHEHPISGDRVRPGKPEMAMMETIVPERGDEPPRTIPP